MTMRSMTGFGQASAEHAPWRIQVTVRAVNHRYLDSALRLPEICRAGEAEILRMIGDRISRGRVELTVDVSALDGGPARVVLHSDVALSLSKAAGALAREGGLDSKLALGDLLRLPGVVEVRSSEALWDEGAAERLLEVIGRAMAQLVSAREEEGARLEAVSLEKLDQLTGLVEELEARRPEVQAALAEALRGRLEKVAEGTEVGVDRLLQEVALLVDRSNVSEEIERLTIHLGHLREILTETGPIGKRLDFLVQEVFRELNTMSAKCRSSDMTRLCVDAKVLCEELREQLRNVE